VIELADHRLTSKRFGTDCHGQVRSLAGHGGALSAVQPLAADLAQRVRPALGRCPIVVLAARPSLGIQHGAQGGEQRLSRLRIEVPVDPDHPEQRHRGVQPPAGAP